jgi:hypothetical protein
MYKNTYITDFQYHCNEIMYESLSISIIIIK